MDKIVGIAVASRIRAGKIRHIATPALWLQLAVQEQQVRPAKVGTKENAADLGARFFEGALIDRHLMSAGFVSLQGATKAEPSMPEEERVRIKTCHAAPKSHTMTPYKAI
eukprot:3237025-Amphidinium_carterae.1